MLLIDNETVRQVLTMADCIAVQERAFAATLDGQAISRPRIDMFVPCDLEDGYFRWGSVEGASDGVMAIRMKSDIMTWPKRSDGSWSESKHCVRPGTYCGLVLLFSTGNGEPLAIINDGHLQHMRVGGAAGIGARLLSRPESKIVGLIGSGGMARTVTEALVTVRDIRAIRVFSPHETRRKAFAEEMTIKLGTEVLAVDSARAAVTGADIVATCTDSMEPVIDAAWLEPGMHVVNIGPHDLGADAEALIDLVVRQGEEALELPESATFRHGIGHSRGAYVAGNAAQQARLPVRTRNKSKGQRRWPLYGEVLAGDAQGRTSSDQITQYRPVGNWGLQFSSVGAHVYRLAQARRLGRALPTEWFLQDIKN